ncbi:hypothetical protein HID58_001631, partial [Brassica napus]
ISLSAELTKKIETRGSSLASKCFCSSSSSLETSSPRPTKPSKAVAVPAGLPRQNCCAKSSQEEEVISPPDENLLIYCKPARLYNILRIRSLFNSGSAGIVVFNYKDCRVAVIGLKQGFKDVVQEIESEVSCKLEQVYTFCAFSFNQKDRRRYTRLQHVIFELGASELVGSINRPRAWPAFRVYVSIVVEVPFESL